MRGTLYGLGVGPGDPELITLKAYRKLMEIPVIAYPQKQKGSNSYAQKIIDIYIDPSKKEMLPLVFPMTKDKSILELEWNRAIDQIWEHLNDGKDVAFITEGDALLYSTFIHLMNTMKLRYPEAVICTVPGISSIQGAAASLGLPLAEGDDHIAIVPARKDCEAMKKVLLENDCIIFLKVAKVIDVIVPILEELNLKEKASLITKATSDEEKIWSIDEAINNKVEYLSLMVVRK